MKVSKYQIEFQEKSEQSFNLKQVQNYCSRHWVGDFFWGSLSPFFLHESFSYGQISLPPKFQLPRQTPSGRKVCGRKEERKKEEEEYRVRQRGCSLTHSARTPPAVFRRN